MASRAVTRGSAVAAGTRPGTGVVKGEAVAGDAKGLAVRGVVVRYDGARRRRGRAETTARPRPAVDGVSIDVAPGQIVALLGPSGCGKSSLLRAVAGLEPLAGGAVAWGGHDLAGVPVHRRGFVLMFQDGQLFAHRDVAGNVAYGLARSVASATKEGSRPGSGGWGSLRGRRVAKRAAAARVKELLGIVGLTGYEHRPVATLSGGEQQRVALARALAPSPRLVLLDEPLSALDRGLRERLAVEVREVLKATGTTAILVTHDHDEAATIADRVAVMSGGTLLQIDTPEGLWKNPTSVEVARFLGYQAFVPAADAGWMGAGAESEPGADCAAARGREMVAIGPRGLRLVGALGRDRALSVGEWPATIVGTTVRRGAPEVSVDVELPAGVRRLAVAGFDAHADVAPGAGWPGTPAPGDRVVVALDPVGCAIVGDDTTDGTTGTGDGAEADPSAGGEGRGGSAGYATAVGAG